MNEEKQPELQSGNNKKKPSDNHPLPGQAGTCKECENRMLRYKYPLMIVGMILLTVYVYVTVTNWASLSDRDTVIRNCNTALEHDYAAMGACELQCGVPSMVNLSNLSQR